MDVAAPSLDGVSLAVCAQRGFSGISAGPTGNPVAPVAGAVAVAPGTPLGVPAVHWKDE